jgi:hypothetical protein
MAFSTAAIPILSAQHLIFIHAFETPRIEICTLVVAINLSLCVVGVQVVHLCQLRPSRALHSMAYLVNVTLVMVSIVYTHRMLAGLSVNNRYCPGFREATIDTAVTTERICE